MTQPHTYGAAVDMTRSPAASGTHAGANEFTGP